MAQRLWKGIKDSTRVWAIFTEQTVAGIQGLLQQEEQNDSWQLVWDEVDDLHLESKEVQADADMAAQRKRPDAWAVSWENISELGCSNFCLISGFLFLSHFCLISV
jgi:hypothetical protein